MPVYPTNVTRLQITVDGYAWRVYGVDWRGRWHCHLIERLGFVAYTQPITKPFRDQLREAIAVARGINTDQVVRITSELIMV